MSVSGLLPIFLKANLPILVVGGGKVAARKVATMLACGAGDVTVVSPTFDEKMPDNVWRIAGAFRVEHLDGVRLVVAATDDAAVNQSVQDAAGARGILCVRLDDAAAGDGVLPATAVLDTIRCALTTGDPATTKAVMADVRRVLQRHEAAAADAAAKRLSSKNARGDRVET